MAVDFTLQMIEATFSIEQTRPDDRRTVGAGFLVEAPGPDQAPRVVLVTARHVLDRMPGEEARLGFRYRNPDGSWRLQRESIRIRDGQGPLWTGHPTQDVAVITVRAPPEIARQAIPLSWLAGSDGIEGTGVGPGDEMVTLGFPNGYSSNAVGFPILRAGRLASYPLGPITAFPTLLLDFTVMSGYSGGPVFMTDDARRASADAPPRAGFVAGVLTESSIELNVGRFAQAAFVREAIALMDVLPAPDAAAPADNAP